MKTKLNCNGCTLCCHNQHVSKFHGDDETLDWVEGENGRKMLNHKPDGSCIYLKENGCGIYERRPYACAKFDCRALVEKFGEKDVDNKAMYKHAINLLVLDRMA